LREARDEGRDRPYAKYEREKRSQRRFPRRQRSFDTIVAHPRTPFWATGRCSSRKPRSGVSYTLTVIYIGFRSMRKRCRSASAKRCPPRRTHPNGMSRKYARTL